MEVKFIKNKRVTVKSKIIASSVAIFFLLISLTALFSYQINFMTSDKKAVTASASWQTRSFTQRTFDNNTFTNQVGNFFSADAAATLQFRTYGNLSTHNGHAAFSAGTEMRIANVNKGEHHYFGDRRRLANSGVSSFCAGHLGFSRPSPMFPSLYPTLRLTTFQTRLGMGAMLINTPDRVNSNPRHIASVFSAGRSHVYLPAFLVPGFYQISFYFETYRRGGGFLGFDGDWRWHRLDFNFYIMPTHGSNGMPNSINIENTERFNIPRNGVSRTGGRIIDAVTDSNFLRDNLRVQYRRFNVGATTPSTNISVGNGFEFSGNGRHEFDVYRGPFRVESFFVIVDNATPAGTFSNVARTEGNVTISKSFTEFIFNAGGHTTAPLVAMIYCAGTEEFLGFDTSGSVTLVEGNYRIELMINSVIAGGVFPVSVFHVRVEPPVVPTTNFTKLSDNRFNNMITQWFDVVNFETGETMAFGNYIIAFQHAMAVEDVRVLDETLFITHYHSMFSNVAAIYNSHSGNHAERIAAMRSDVHENMELTSAMNILAERNTRQTFFDPNDKQERIFDNATMFDSTIWLNCDFVFTTTGPLDSYKITFTNGDTTGTILHNIPIGEQNLPSGIYQIKEQDVFGTYIVYTVFRDVCPPVIETSFGIAQDGGVYNVEYFVIEEIIDLDSWTVLRVNDEHFLTDSVPLVFDRAGTFEITAFDRNGNTISFTVITTGRQSPSMPQQHEPTTPDKITIQGAVNKTIANNDVLIIYDEQEFEIEKRINGRVVNVANNGEILLAQSTQETHFFLIFTSGIDHFYVYIIIKGGIS